MMRTLLKAANDNICFLLNMTVCFLICLYGRNCHAKTFPGIKQIGHIQNTETICLDLPQYEIAGSSVCDMLRNFLASERRQLYYDREAYIGIRAMYSWPGCSAFELGTLYPNISSSSAVGAMKYSGHTFILLNSSSTGNIASPFVCTRRSLTVPFYSCVSQKTEIRLKWLSTMPTLDSSCEIWTFIYSEHLGMSPVLEAFPSQFPRNTGFKEHKITGFLPEIQNHWPRLIDSTDADMMSMVYEDRHEYLLHDHLLDSGLQSEIFHPEVGVSRKMYEICIKNASLLKIIASFIESDRLAPYYLQGRPMSIRLIRCDDFCIRPQLGTLYPNLIFPWNDGVICLYGQNIVLSNFTDNFDYADVFYETGNIRTVDYYGHSYITDGPKVYFRNLLHDCDSERIFNSLTIEIDRSTGEASVISMIHSRFNLIF